MQYGLEGTPVPCLTVEILPVLASSLCITGACFSLWHDTQLSSQKLLQRRISFHRTDATHTLVSSELCVSSTSTCAVWQNVGCFLEQLKD